MAAVAAVVLVVCTARARDLATGYELDIIASASWGASLSGRTRVRAVLRGNLIFGVCGNAVAQIPGATSTRLRGLVVIVVMDQVMARQGK